jgi:precorrin-4 methylase
MLSVNLLQRSKIIIISKLINERKLQRSKIYVNKFLSDIDEFQW